MAWLLLTMALGPAGLGEALTGIWHNNTCVGSGYSELYAFFPDGSFLWSENQMDGVARVRERWGAWTVEGDSLLLLVDSMLVWDGGRMVPAECSVGTDSMLADFEESVLRPVPPESILVGVSDLRLDLMDENPDLPADLWGVDLDGSRFWRIRSDPADIEEML